MYSQRRGLCTLITHGELNDSSIRGDKGHRLEREQRMFEPCPHMYVEGCTCLMGQDCNHTKSKLNDEVT